MGDLGKDTELAEIGEGHYQATLSEDWEIWGPNGGYLAAILLRAVGAHTGLPRPASLQCHYLGVARFAPVDVHVSTIRAGRRAHSVRVTMTQDGSPVCEAMAWAVGDPGEIEGFGHDTAVAPVVARPEELTPFAELPGSEESLRFRFWHNFDYRPLDWLDQDEWMTREPAEPLARAWMRFVPTGTFDDPWVDAGRAAILLDTFLWPAACRAYTSEMGFMGPSMDLAVQFHRMAPESEWLLYDSWSPVGTDGMIGGMAKLWSDDGRLLASGVQQLLVRGVPPPHRRPPESGSVRARHPSAPSRRRPSIRRGRAV
jgi:acyl-CoA thioesterase